MSNAPLKPYPTYKPAGVPWLQQVPEHWGSARAKTLFEKVERPVRSEDETVTCFRDGTVTLRKNRRATGYTESLKEIGYQGIRKGDLVIHIMDAFAGSMGVSDSEGKSTPVYSVCIPRGSEVPWYFAFQLRQMAKAGWLQALSKGIRERSSDFRFELFGMQTMLVPPPAEQHLIVRYLHALDAKVKRYIRTKRSLIARLQEQKQAIIQQAVTRGLDPNVKLKPSGVEWLGEVPEHWEVSMVKRQYSVELGKMLNTHKSVGIPQYEYLNAANIHWDRIKLAKVNKMAFTKDQQPRYLLDRGDVLITEGGATVGRTAIWNAELGECYYQNSINRARPTGHLPGRFLLHWMHYVTRSGLIEAAANAATFGHLTKEKLSRLPLLVPATGEEAMRIVEHIDTEVASLVKPEERLNAQILRMLEYHTRLIADVVTGAVDVTAAAQALPADQTIGGSDDQIMEEEELEVEEEAGEE